MLPRIAILAAAGLALAAPAALAQQAPPLSEAYQRIDAQLQQLPDSATRSVGSLTRHLRAAYSTEEERAWAAFDWVARHLRYDVANMNSSDPTRQPAEIARQALSKRLGLSEDFAELYAALARGLDLRTQVVMGFTKRADGWVSLVPQYWCATRIGGQWQLLDPTLAAGPVTKGTFVPQLNAFYFQTTPADFARSHLPFDPLWQLLPAPYSLDQFRQGTVPPPPAQPWAVADSLAAYERLSHVQQLRAAGQRARRADIRHPLAQSYQSQIQEREQELQVTEHNRMLLAYNRAQEHTQQAVSQLNAFFNYYNHQFQPRKTDAQLRQLLPPIAAELQQAKAILATVKFADASRQATVQALRASVRTGETRLGKSQTFLARYLRTAPAQRPDLFTTRSGPNEMTR